MKFPKIALFCIVLLFFVSACKTIEEEPKEKIVELGKTITFDYAAGFDNGTLFDTSFEAAAREAGIYDPDRSYQPIKTIYGESPLILGLGEALLGMKEDETKNIRVPPDKAYGVFIEDSIRILPKNSIKGTGEMKVGQIIDIVVSGGQRVPSYIKEIGEENITVELKNHPLAGEYIQFSIIVRSIE
jgi:peptidylprolyl isomerase